MRIKSLKIQNVSGPNRPKFALFDRGLAFYSCSLIPQINADNVKLVFREGPAEPGKILPPE
jgi:hypothetical protein